MGAGAINAMNSSIKQNRKLLGSAKARRASFMKRSLGISNNKAAFEFPISKPWVNRAIKDKLRRDYKLAALRLWGVMALFIIFFIYFLATIIF